MITGNKGEWSEIYALFKLLGEKTLFAGDADLKKVEHILPNHKSYQKRNRWKL